MTKDFSLKQIQYIVLPAQGPLNESNEKLRSQLFTFWKGFWEQLFQSLGSKSNLDPDDFYRQDLITALMHENEVVGMHLLTGYTEKDLNSHSYFSHYRPEFIHRLQEHGAKRILALQYFMVDEQWQKSVAGQNFAAIIAALAARQQIIRKYDVSVTLARHDIHVSALAKKLGCVDLADGIEMHNVQVSLLACFHPVPYPDKRVNEAVDELWNRRIEIITIDESIKRAAFEDRGFYARWLNQQLYLVQHSSRYLALSASKVKIGASAEFQWWIHHLTEEVDHDRTIANDLKALGFLPGFEPACAEVRAIVAAQYQGIQQYGGDALLGYALLLEGLSCKVCGAIADRVEKAFGTQATIYGCTL